MRLITDQKGIGLVLPILIVVLVAAGGVVAWRLVDSNQDTSNNQASLSKEDPIESIDQLPEDLSDIKTVKEIQEQVASEALGVSIVGIELETEDGKTVYVVHLSDGTIMAYDAYSGLAVNISDDNDDKFENNSLPANFVASVTIQEAIQIAKQKRPSSIVEKVEFEFEDGVVVYSVRFTDDSRVDVSAVDGSVQRLKNENGTDLMKADNDFDDDGLDNSEDSDDDNDGIKDDDDDDDDNDGIKDDDDDDDDNDGIKDDDDDDESDNSGSGSSNSGSGSN